jgi:hypothetical protein
MGRELKEGLNQEFSLSKKRAHLTQGEMLRIIRGKNELSQNQLPFAL